MQLIRQTEEELARCHQRGLIHGACHTYVGQEAIATGVCAHLTRRTWSSARIAATATRWPRACRRAADRRAVRPRDRLLARPRRQHAPVRARDRHDGHQRHRRAVHPAGLRRRATASSCCKTDSVAVAFFGDGAVNNGAFHEGLNMASIWKLPVLFVCENNQFATEVPFAYASRQPRASASRGGGLRHAGRRSRRQRRAGRLSRRPARRSRGPAAARARRCSSARPTAPAPTPRGWATSPTARARKSSSGRRAARSQRLRQQLLDESASTERRNSTRSTPRSRAQVAEARAVRREQPLARAGDRDDACLLPSRRTPSPHCRTAPPAQRARSPISQADARSARRRDGRATRRSS